jgi:hypothetical protein
MMKKSELNLHPSEEKLPACIKTDRRAAEKVTVAASTKGT